MTSKKSGWNVSRFPTVEPSGGVRVPDKRTLFAGRKTESPDRPGNPAAKAVRVIPALSGKSTGYLGRFGV